MLEVMEAYASQALKINSLELQVKKLQMELETTKANTISKEDIKTWFSSINSTYVFLTDEGKELAYITLGEK